MNQAQLHLSVRRFHTTVTLERASEKNTSTWIPAWILLKTPECGNVFSNCAAEKRIILAVFEHHGPLILINWGDDKISRKMEFLGVSISYNFDFLLIVAGNFLAVCHVLCNGAALFVLRGRSGLLGKI